jgi:hypothetical protein
MNVKYGFTIIDDDNPNSILHMVGFENKPSSQDWNHILEELETDPEFSSFLNEYRWTMRYSTDKEVDLIKELMEAHTNGENPDIDIVTHDKHDTRRDTTIKH